MLRQRWRLKWARSVNASAFSPSRVTVSGGEHSSTACTIILQYQGLCEAAAPYTTEENTRRGEEQQIEAFRSPGCRRRAFNTWPRPGPDPGATARTTFHDFFNLKSTVIRGRWFDPSRFCPRERMSPPRIPWRKFGYQLQLNIRQLIRILRGEYYAFVVDHKCV